MTKTASWTRENLAWLAGLVEGEGSITSERNGRTLRIKVKMTDEDVIRRAHEVAGLGRVYGPYKAYRPKDGSRAKDQWVWICQRSADAYAITVAIAYWLGSRRRSQMTHSITTWNSYQDTRGKDQAGYKNPYAKLSPEMVDKIRTSYDGRKFGYGQLSRLCRELGVGPCTVRRVAQGKSYV